MPRKAISNKLRFEVFKRDDFLCQYCGNHPPKAILHVDHITPVKLGGDNDINNLITSCSICNSGKSATPLSSIPKSLKDSAAEIKAKEAQIAGYNKAARARAERIETETWEVANAFLAERLQPLNSIDKSWFRSIKNFIERLGVSECLDAVDILSTKRIYSTNKAFTYFCGICWNKIKENE